MAASLAHRRDILIVGSVPLSNTEAVIRAIAAALGDRVRRMTVDFATW